MTKKLQFYSYNKRLTGKGSGESKMALGGQSGSKLGVSMGRDNIMKQAKITLLNKVKIIKKANI